MKTTRLLFCFWALLSIVCEMAIAENCCTCTYVREIDKKTQDVYFDECSMEMKVIGGVSCDEYCKKIEFNSGAVRECPDEVYDNCADELKKVREESNERY